MLVAASAPPAEPADQPMDVHQASTVALIFKKRLESYFQSRAAELDAPDPELLAAQLTAVFDGCSVRAVMRAQPLDGLAVRTATALLDAAA